MLKWTKKAFFLDSIRFFVFFCFITFFCVFNEFFIIFRYAVSFFSLIFTCTLRLTQIHHHSYMRRTLRYYHIFHITKKSFFFCCLLFFVFVDWLFCHTPAPDPLAKQRIKYIINTIFSLNICSHKLLIFYEYSFFSLSILLFLFVQLLHCVFDMICSFDLCVWNNIGHFIFLIILFFLFVSLLLFCIHFSNKCIYIYNYTSLWWLRFYYAFAFFSFHLFVFSLSSFWLKLWTHWNWTLRKKNYFAYVCFFNCRSGRFSFI